MLLIEQITAGDSTNEKICNDVDDEDSMLDDETEYEDDGEIEDSGDGGEDSGGDENLFG